MTGKRPFSFALNQGVQLTPKALTGLASQRELVEFEYCLTFEDLKDLRGVTFEQCIAMVFIAWRRKIPRTARPLPGGLTLALRLSEASTAGRQARHLGENVHWRTTGLDGLVACRVGGSVQVIVRGALGPTCGDVAQIVCILEPWWSPWTAPAKSSIAEQ